MSDCHADPVPTVESAVSWTTPFPDFTDDYYVEQAIRNLQQSHLERIAEEESA